MRMQALCMLLPQPAAQCVSTGRSSAGTGTAASAKRHSSTKSHWHMGQTSPSLTMARSGAPPPLTPPPLPFPWTLRPPPRRRKLCDPRSRRARSAVR